jgi:cytochrome c55X
MARTQHGRWRPNSALAAAVALMLAMALPADAVDAPRARALTDLVRQDCGSCHGMTLKGGLGTSLLPADIEHIEAEGIARIIIEGIPGTPMPAWRGALSEEDAQWIARRLKEGFPQ